MEKKKKDVLPTGTFLIVFCSSVKGKIISYFKTFWPTLDSLS